jgi:hypothetical protein
MDLAALKTDHRFGQISQITQMVRELGREMGTKSGDPSEAWWIATVARIYYFNLHFLCDLAMTVTLFGCGLRHQFPHQIMFYQISSNLHSVSCCTFA